MKDLGRRAVASSISIAFVACFLIFAFSPWFQYIVATGIALLAAVAVWEYGQFAKAKGGQILTAFLFVLTLLEVIAFFVAARHPMLESLPLIVFFIGLLVLFALHFRQNEGAVVDLAVSSFGQIYIAVPMGMVLGILYFSGEEDGRWWLAYLLSVTKIADMGAYFAGSLWGRFKLAPQISPGKTIEGAIFGLICAMSASYGFHRISELPATVGFHLGTFEWVFLGLVLGLVGQFGDLSESLLKRDANKKDSNDLPGLGGVLDAVDSLLFNVPILYLYLVFLKP